MNNNILKRAKELLGKNYDADRKALPGSAGLTRAREILTTRGNLDVYIIFDTTGSMSTYINEVRDNLARVTDAIIDGKNNTRLSINGVGDHCDGANILQLYALTSDPAEAQGSIDAIVMTDGGDAPEAYECLAIALAKRLPNESTSRKRAVVLVADSIPHGMTDQPCERGVDYATAFEALKTLCDGFYFVGCNPQMYGQQRQLIDQTRKDREQFIPLGDMVDVLPTLLAALAKRTESEKALTDYLKLVEHQNPSTAQKVRGLLTR
ncbi:VWA domain-containing protein [Candidatus Woesearchaeota archaeon]|nr:VWA domain-containing protein [Candidatus Woesearchaeota archaeon]